MPECVINHKICTKIYRHNGSNALSQRGRGVAFVPTALFSLCLTADVGHLGQLSFVRFRPWSDQLARLLRTPCERAEKSASPCPLATNDTPTCATPDKGLGIKPDGPSLLVPGKEVPPALLALLVSAPPLLRSLGPRPGVPNPQAMDRYQSMAC